MLVAQELMDPKATEDHKALLDLKEEKEYLCVPLT